MRKDIKGFEGYYQISTDGKVYSLPRVVTRKNGTELTVKERVLKPHQIQKGYIQVMLTKDGKHFPKLVHRLVAEAFLHSDDPEAIVNHKDLDKTNNDISNLEWVTHKENTLHAWKMGACMETLKKRSRSVENTITGEVYPSISAAARMTGIPYATMHRKIKSEGGHYRYAE